MLDYTKVILFAKQSWIVCCWDFIIEMHIGVLFCCILTMLIELRFEIEEVIDKIYWIGICFCDWKFIELRLILRLFFLMDLHNNINLVNKINIGRFLISLKITMKQAMEKYKITKTDYSFTINKSLAVIFEEYPNFINFRLPLKKWKII